MGSKDLAYKDFKRLPSAAAGVSTEEVPILQGSNITKMTLAQIATFVAANLGIATAALSAGTFSTTGATSGAMGAVTSGDGNCFGLATIGQLEFLISTVLNNKDAIDELR